VIFRLCSSIGPARHLDVHFWVISLSSASLTLSQYALVLLEGTTPGLLEITAKLNVWVCKRLYNGVLPCLASTYGRFGLQQSALGLLLMYCIQPESAAFARGCAVGYSPFLWSRACMQNTLHGVLCRRVGIQCGGLLIPCTYDTRM